jgi:hypothetical protein
LLGDDLLALLVVYLEVLVFHALVVQVVYPMVLA